MGGEIMAQRNNEDFDELQSLSDMQAMHSGDELPTASRLGGINLGSYKPEDEELGMESLKQPSNNIEPPVLDYEGPEQASDSKLNEMIADKYKELEGVDGGLAGIKYAFNKAVNESRYTPDKNPDKFTSSKNGSARLKNSILIPIAIFLVLIGIAVSLITVGNNMREDFYNEDITQVGKEKDSKLDIYLEGNNNGSNTKESKQSR